MTTIPITINSDAEARVAELGMQRELDQMLEHTCQTVAGLRSVEVTLTPPCDPGDDPRVVLEVTRLHPKQTNDSIWRQWRDWMVETFPSDVLRHFNLLTAYGAADAG